MTVLIQWFYTVYLLGMPITVGPFVNEIQCDNHVSNVRTTMPERPDQAYKPMCVEHRFEITIIDSNKYTNGGH